MIEKKLSIGIDISKLTLDICILNDDAIDHYQIKNRPTAIKRFIRKMSKKYNLIAFRANFRKNFNILLAKNATEVLEILSENLIDVVITDHMMPQISGAELLEKLKNEQPHIGRILITGVIDISIITEAINKCEVFRFLTKPWVKDDLIKTIDSCYLANQEQLQEHQMKEKLLETNQQLEFMLIQKLLS